MADDFNASCDGYSFDAAKPGVKGENTFFCGHPSLQQKVQEKTFENSEDDRQITDFL